jgi:hypothetical protein
MSTGTSKLIPIVAGRVCAGHLINLGPRGVEAFNKDDISLGIFPDVIAAASAVEKSAVAIKGSAP